MLLLLLLVQIETMSMRLLRRQQRPAFAVGYERAGLRNWKKRLQRGLVVQGRSGGVVVAVDAAVEELGEGGKGMQMPIGKCADMLLVVVVVVAETVAADHGVFEGSADVHNPAVAGTVANAAAAIAAVTPAVVDDELGRC